MAANKVKQYRAYRDIAHSRLIGMYTVAHNALTDEDLHVAFKMRYLTLESVYSEFNTQHNNIIHYLATQEDADIPGEEETRLDADKKYFSIKEVYHNLFENTLTATPSVATTSNVKLPKLNVPIFSGNLKDWPAFSELFNSVVHTSPTLTDIGKFQYLLSVVSGEALTLIKNVPLSGENYETAYNHLKHRYQNKRLLATFYWEEITKAPKLSTESSRSLRNLLDIFSDNLAALANLKFPVQKWDFILFNLLSKKIDTETLKRFELHHSSVDIPTYDSLFDFLNKQCIAFDSIALAKPTTKFNSNSHSQKHFVSKTTNSTSTFFANTNSTIMKCPLCKLEHSIYKCSIFNAKTPNERYDLIKQNKWCTNCLGSKHTSQKCNSSSSCRICHKNHHTLLHFNNNQSSQALATVDNSGGGQVKQVGEPIPSTSQLNSLSNVVPSNSTVLLSTALIEILDCRGHYQLVRVLLDSASQANFITERCAHRLGLVRSKVSLSINGLGQMSSVVSGSVTCTIKPQGQLEPSLTFDALTLPKICSDMPTSKIPIQKWDHISNLKLADPHFNMTGPIDMLLGADVFPLILKNGRLTGSLTEPSAINTIFGWIIMGKVNCDNAPSLNTFYTSFDLTIDTSLRKFWELEEVPCENISSPEDIQCENIFTTTHFRNHSGRFVVSLPFVGTEPSFKDTRPQALRRFYSLERRLLQNSPLYLEYVHFMTDYLRSNHMEPVENAPLSDKCYYIPHHCVLTPNSSTTKLRVVFDASTKSPEGISLNDTLLVGKKLQQDIAGILLNFRLHKYVFTADIRQMYRQILVTEDHWDYQRILWRFSPSEPIQDFRLKTVTYGVSSAPFLALRTLMQLAMDEKPNFPLATKVLSRDIYVDDLVTGCNELVEAQNLQAEIISLLKKGGFELRKWASNSPTLLENIPISHCQQSSLNFDSEHDSIVKILGLNWSPSLDSFAYHVAPLSRPCTKRSILSEISRIFDPLGFLAPLSFFAKYLIQHLWSLGLSWDQTPPSYIVEKWTQYKRELPCLSNINISRHLSDNNFSSCEIHGFADSSEKGYAAVVYLRFLFTNGNIKVQLLCAKSKVAPLKTISVPRLELCATVLLANLMDFVLQTYSITLRFDKIFAWTDSMVALSWIQSSPHRWKTFISNRVSHIQSKISPMHWHHVSSPDNPADCASRGLLPSELVNNSLWWNGPPWLTSSQALWPRSSPPNSSLTLDEEKKISLTSFVSLDSLDYLLNRYSSLPKIKRILAYSLLFIYNLKNPQARRFPPFSQVELHQALLVLVKRVQHTNFKNEIINLENNTRVSKPLRKLNPFFGEDGLLRVGGRLIHSSLSYDRKHPILLPRSHRLTELIVENCHREHCHPGLQTLHFLLRQQFWILSPKRAIRHTLSKCHKCFRTKPVSLEPPMGDLPSFRINQVKAFQCSGIDYGGPFYVTLGKRRGIKSQKAYICLFVCFVTKAVHLELASDLSTEAFLAALRRFIARRGRCTHIFSDCGTNFVGGQKYISNCMKDSVESEKIKWSFNPPSAPHFGGLWESGIKSVKTHLNRVVGNQILTYEELYTVLTQIEALLNSRPLCSISSDPNDLSVLTPGHFLTLEPLTVIPDPDLSHLTLNRLNRWQLLQRLHQDFWRRWHDEYLHTLQQRNKWTSPEKLLEPGTLVLIKRELTPPLQWRLGRVVETHPGPDGIARVATISTSQGLLQRPLVKLCPLPSY